MNLNNLIPSPLSKNQYYPVICNKKQIVLHHTVSGADAKNVINAWENSPEKVATAFVIDGKGNIYQCFNSAHWAHHLGTHFKNNTLLNQQSIGIEICNWGPLTEKNGQFYSTFNKEVPKEEVIDYQVPWRGHRYFHKYKEEQLLALKVLIEYLCDKYKIPKIYHSDMWDLSQKAVEGTPGIWTHVSFRKDKTDCHPQEDLINMLKRLSDK